MSSATGMQTAVGSGPVLRVIAHELRQPLSTIEAIAYYLSLVLPRSDEKVHEQVNRLQQLVEQSNWILANSLNLTEPMACSPEPLDLGELITQSIALRPLVNDPRPSLDLASNLPLIRADPGLARALVENLLTLFRQHSTKSDPVTVRTRAHENGVMLEMTAALAGAGAGAATGSETALGPGTALSLDSARRIVAAHGGTLEFEAGPESGIRLRIVLG